MTYSFHEVAKRVSVTKKIKNAGVVCHNETEVKSRVPFLRIVNPEKMDVGGGNHLLLQSQRALEGGTHAYSSTSAFIQA